MLGPSSRVCDSSAWWRVPPLVWRPRPYRDGEGTATFFKSTDQQPPGHPQLNLFSREWGVAPQLAKQELPGRVGGRGTVGEDRELLGRGPTAVVAGTKVSGEGERHDDPHEAFVEDNQRGEAVTP